MKPLVWMADGGGSAPGPMFWCVACRCAHGGFAGWTWDGNETTPTITPSYAVRSGERPYCHVSIVSGWLVYHPDSQHALSGRTVSMVPL